MINLGFFENRFMLDPFSKELRKAICMLSRANNTVYRYFENYNRIHEYVCRIIFCRINDRLS